MLSDDSTSDSDTGIRFKTDSTRRPTTNDDDNLKNRKNENPRFRESNKNYSSRRSPPRRRERSPIRDDRHKDRHKSDYDHHRSSFYDKDRGGKDSNKYSSKGEERSRSDDKKSYDKESRTSSKSTKNDVEKKLDSTTQEFPKDRRSDIGCRLSQKSSSKDVYDRLSSRYPESHNRHSTKRDKHSPTDGDDLSDCQSNGKVDSTSKNISMRLSNREQKIKVSSESPKPYKRSVTKSRIDDDNEQGNEKRTKHDEIINNVSPPRRLSDASDNEQKPISYYNMVSSTYESDNEKHETIAVSDSSEDEATLRKQLLLLEHELKKTKNKKKSKHRDKRKCSKSKHQKSESDEDSKSQDSNVISVDDKSNCDESNEEGEIVSDSDDKLSRDDLRTKQHSKQRKLDKHNLPDLRDHLTSKVSMLDKSASSREDKSVESAEEEEVEGPALPPHMMKSTNIPKNIGPSLPDSMRKKLLERSEHYSNADTTVDQTQSSDDDDTYGPLPEDSKNISASQRRLEERALKMKISSLDSNKDNEQQKDSREEWMLKLPDAKAKHLGLTSRQFRSREGPDLSDRSSWTDTPEEKAMKAAGIEPNGEKDNNEKLLRNAEMEFILQRDTEQESIVRKHKKKSKRKDSLLDIHQKKLKKKKKKEEKEETVRRPFSRDIDLKANRFDEAQKKAIIKKAQLLDTRFSRGESKFL